MENICACEFAEYIRMYAVCGFDCSVIGTLNEQLKICTVDVPYVLITEFAGVSELAFTTGIVPPTRIVKQTVFEVSKAESTALEQTVYCPAATVVLNVIFL